MKKQILCSFLLLLSVWLSAQEVRRDFFIPDILGYQTLKGDFHMHTVFSDGKVWPDIRVVEAWQEGLDVIAITEHVEHTNDLLPHDHNKSFEIAKKEGDKRGIMVIRGAEITRKLPEECGHMNALFLSDVNLIEQEHYMDAIEEAHKQDAFIFWNHPGWHAHQPDTTVWFDIFTQLIDKNMMHGIEVVNWKRMFPEAINWCMDKNLTMLANSDIHNPITFVYDFCKGDHRPTTVMFVKEKTEEGVKDALMNQRTVAYFKRGFYNQFMGKEEYLKALFFASIEIELVNNTETSTNINLKNNSDLDFLLVKKNTDGRLNYRKHYFLYGQSQESIGIRKSEPVNNEDLKLVFIIENLYKRPGESITVEIPVF